MFYAAIDCVRRQRQAATLIRATCLVAD